MTDLVPKTEKRSLRCDLTAKEVHDVSIQLAEKNKSLVAIEEEKKSVTSQYKARIDETKATINKLSNVVTDGFEMREIECTIEYHKPSQGKKTIIRKDLDKTHAIESMEEWEFNLFNQPDDKETEDIMDKEREVLRGNRDGKKKRGKK